MSEKVRREFVRQMCEVYENNIHHLESMLLDIIASYLKKIRALCKEYPDCKNFDYCYSCPVGRVIAHLEVMINSLAPRVQDIIDLHFAKRPNKELEGVKL